MIRCDVCACKELCDRIARDGKRIPCLELWSLIAKLDEEMHKDDENDEDDYYHESLNSLGNNWY